MGLPDAGQQQRFAMLAVGCKAGVVWLWRYHVPHQYTPSGSPSPEAFTLVCPHQARPRHPACPACAAIACLPLYPFVLLMAV